ncbi:response regulator transcription factor [Altererythrobacter sp. CAU 1778]
MIRVNILCTAPDGDEHPDFVHDNQIFSFSRLGPQGLKKLVEGELWIFVDWIMDEFSGLEMCRRLRADERTENAHITMVLDHDDFDDRKRALNAGADAYVVGPIDRRIMLDRVMALQGGRSTRSSFRNLELGRMHIDLAAEQARWDGQPIPLRPNEFRLLRYMAENPNRVLSRNELIEALGKEGDPGYLRTVDVWMKRLRQGLKQVGAQGALRTVHRKGYVLDILD